VHSTDMMYAKLVFSPGKNKNKRIPLCYLSLKTPRVEIPMSNYRTAEPNRSQIKIHKNGSPAKPRVCGEFERNRARKGRHEILENNVRYIQ